MKRQWVGLLPTKKKKNFLTLVDERPINRREGVEPGCFEIRRKTKKGTLASGEEAEEGKKSRGKEGADRWI